MSGASFLNVERSDVRGITLIELLVVMVLIALVGGIVGPAVSRQIDAIALQTAATDLAAQLRRAQAVARVNQVPVAMTYSNKTFQFWKSTKPVATYALPGSILPAHDIPTYVFLPSGQILGGDTLELQNQRGRKIAIHTETLQGITLRFGGVS
jgi:type II secretion system protein H